MSVLKQANSTKRQSMVDAGQPLRIGIDGRYQGQSLTGVPRYIDELCKQLDVLLPEAQFFVYAAKGDGIRLPSNRWELRLEPNPRLTRLKPNIWWKFFAGRLIRKDKLDVFWACAGFIPGGLRGVRVVFTVYDLTFKLFPETMSRTHVWAFRLFFAGDLRRANAVVTISQGTSERLNQYFGRRADAIVKPAAGPQFAPQSEASKNTVRERYRLHHPYLLAVSTLEPRKNLLNLIDAFLLLKQSGGLTDHELVLTGKKGWRSAALDERLLAPSAKAIRWLGYVPDDDLPSLYAASTLFCMPSLYEGFGIPVLEALCCEARVLASDVPELREAGGRDAFYCDTKTSDNLATSILRVTAKAKLPYLKKVSTTWLHQAEELKHTILKVKTINIK